MRYGGGLTTTVRWGGGGAWNQLSFLPLTNHPHRELVHSLTFSPTNLWNLLRIKIFQEYKSRRKPGPLWHIPMKRVTGRGKQCDALSHFASPCHTLCHLLPDSCHTLSSALILIIGNTLTSLQTRLLTNKPYLNIPLTLGAVFAWIQATYFICFDFELNSIWYFTQQYNIEEYSKFLRMNP